MANISIGGRLSLLQRVASLDLRYGPYSSIADAYDNMGPSGDEVITAGLPFGVTEDDGNVSIYIWTKGEDATQTDCRKLDKEHIVLFNGLIDVSVSIKQQSFNNVATKDNIVFLSERKIFAYRDGLNFYTNWKNRYFWSNENFVPYDDVIYIDITSSRAYYFDGVSLSCLTSEVIVTSVNGKAPDASGEVTINKTDIGLENVDNTSDSDKVVKGANEDGSGNNIATTYETKSDATTKNTALQNAISALQTSVGNLTGLDSTNFGGFSIQTTEADAISNIATLYTADGYTDELLWYMAGTSLSSVKAYRYNGSGTPTLISNDSYDCVDFSGLIANVATLSSNLTALGQEMRESINGFVKQTLAIEQGTLSGTGTDSSSSTRLRTNGYVNYSTIRVEVSGTGKFFVLGYDENGFVRADVVLWRTANATISLQGCTKYRLAFANSSDATINPSGFDALGISVYGFDDSKKITVIKQDIVGRLRPNIYLPYANPNYEQYIKELYMPLTPSWLVSVKRYSQKIYIGNNGDTIYGYAELTGVKNGDIVEVKVSTTNDSTNYPVGTVLGYVVFCDINGFAAATSSSISTSYIDISAANNKAYSPTIQTKFALDDSAYVMDAAVEEVEGEIEEVSLIANQADKTLQPFRKTQTFSIADFVDGYTNAYTDNLDIGSTFNFRPNTPATSSSTAAQLAISVKQGDSVTVKMHAKSNAFSVAWVLLDVNQKILSWAGTSTQTFDWLTTPQVFVIENDGYLVLQFFQSDYDSNYNTPMLITRVYSALSETLAKIEALAPTTFLPFKMYGVVGNVMRLYKRGIVCMNDPYLHYHKFDVPIGKVYKRYMEMTPSAAGTYTVKHKLMDDNFNALTQEAVSTLKVCATPSSPVSPINILCVGASTTENGQWVAELKRLLTSNTSVDYSGVAAPTGLNLSNINFVGRQTMRGVSFEATGGWTWARYTSEGVKAIKFTVSGVSAINVGDKYTCTDINDGTCKLVIAEVNITGDSGNIRCTYASDTASREDPKSSGTLTLASGSGSDATISYSSATVERYSPFWNEEDEEVDFEQYVDAYCDGSVDVVITDLNPINNMVMGNESLESVIAAAKSFIDALHLAYPACKVLIIPTIGYSTDYGVEYNYSASSRMTSGGAQRMLFRYCDEINKLCQDSDYSSFCFIVDSMAEIDSENSFPTSTRAINTRSTDTEVIGTNGYHPTERGYMMLADAVFRCFCNEILT